MAGKNRKNEKPRKKGEVKGKPKPENYPLTVNEQLFVQEYLIHRNGMRAYKKVYGTKSFAAATVGASQTLSRANVKAEIRAFIQAQGERTKITADRVLKEIGRIAFADLEELEDEDGKYKRLRDIPLETRRAIAGIELSRERRYKDGDEEEVSDQIVKYKLWDKNAALGKLCKFLGLEVSISPLEALLGALPPDVAATIREALAKGAKDPKA